MSKSYNYNYLTIFFLLTLIFFAFNFYKKEKNVYFDDEDIGRNERSTPRTFVLPSTPAVALIQEKKLMLWENEFFVKNCMLRLYDLGYKFKNFENMDDISIFISVLRFQKKNGLDLTGNFNKETSIKIGCNNHE